MKLRDYQQEAVYSVFRYFEKHGSESGNPLIVLPTGTGKSLVIAGFIELVFRYYGNQNILMLTHVKELIEQNYNKLVAVWPDAPVGIYSAGLNKKELYRPITYAGIGSVKNKAAFFKNTSLIIVDEAHTISPSQSTTYQKFFDEIKQYNPHLKVIGLTATDFRTGFGSIVKQFPEDKALFDAKVFDACTPESFNWFIEQGYLVPVVSKRTKMEFDVSKVKKSMGDFNLKDLQNVVNQDSLTENAIDEAMITADQEHLNSWLVFCSGLEHANTVSQMLNAKGVTCEVVDGKMSAGDRARILNDFKEGKITAIANNNVLTTGFDHPELDLIVMLRPTTSPGLWVQMLGRGTRPVYSEGFDLSTQEGRLQAISASCKQYCRVLDYSGNTRRIGPINDPVKPARPGEKKRKGDAPVKDCARCGAWNHASARYCGGVPAPHQMEGYCGNEFEFQVKLKRQAETKDLIKTTEPVVETFTVRSVIYQKNLNRGDSTKPPTLKVTYDVGSRKIEEFVCINHINEFAARKARQWWRTRTKDIPTPESVDQALQYVAQLPTPTHLRVWVNKAFPEIMDICYDGTCFNTMQATNEQIPIQVLSNNGIDLNSIIANAQNAYETSPEEVSQLNTTIMNARIAENPDEAPW